MKNEKKFCIKIYCSESQKKRLKEVADYLGLSVSGFVLQSAIAAAAKKMERG